MSASLTDLDFYDPSPSGDTAITHYALRITNYQSGGAFMNFLPEYDKVREIAESGKYDILPVSCEILSDICTPIEAMKILKNVSTHCYML